MLKLRSSSTLGRPV